jgi:hypothetical protein
VNGSYGVGRWQPVKTAKCSLVLWSTVVNCKVCEIAIALY